MNNKVYFIGIGPGSPDLLTLRAYHIICRAQVIIYPGSLISSEMIDFLKKENPHAELYDAYGKSLSQIIEKIENALNKNQTVARLVSGDPSLYSSIMEHIEILREKNYPYEIIPGISSVFAASSKLGIEFTYPNLSHTLILTRFEGKTGGATEKEILTFLQTKSTLVFFLSSGLKDKLYNTLKKILPLDTKVAILYKLTHPEEKIFITTLENLPKTMEENNINKSALIVVGDILNLIDKNFYKRSILYAEK
ncbi:MAG: cobalt-precorrin-4/precorrin-4 C(11)-methyltransferase [Caldimicrobium sp.]